MGGKLYITNIGKAIAVSTLSGKTIAFTHFAVGKGIISNPTELYIKELTSLVNPVISNIAITSGTEKNAYIALDGQFSSGDQFDSFQLSELGVYACGQGEENFVGDGTTTSFVLVSPTYMIYYIEAGDGTDSEVVPPSDYSFDASTNTVSFATAPANGTTINIYYPDTSNEKLFAYEYFDSPNSVKHTEEGAVSNSYAIHVDISIADASNVTVMFDTGSSFAPHDLFDSHVNNKNNPHRVNASQIKITGDDGTTTVNQMSPTVPTTTGLETIVQGDNIRTILGKVKRAISFLLDSVAGFAHHIAPTTVNPHEVSLSQLGGMLPIDRGGTGSNGNLGTFSSFWNYLFNAEKPANNPYGQIKFGSYIGSSSDIGGSQYIQLGMNNTKMVVVIPYCGFSFPFAEQQTTPPGRNLTFGGIALDGYKCHSTQQPVEPDVPADIHTWDAMTGLMLESSSNQFRVGNAWVTSSGVSLAKTDVMYYYFAISSDKVYDFGTGSTPIN